MPLKSGKGCTVVLSLTRLLVPVPGRPPSRWVVLLGCCHLPPLRYPPPQGSVPAVQGPLSRRLILASASRARQGSGSLGCPSVLSPGRSPPGSRCPGGPTEGVVPKGKLLPGLAEDVLRVAALLAGWSALLPELGGVGIPSPAVPLQSRGCPASASASPPPPSAAPHLPRAAALPGAPETSWLPAPSAVPRRPGRFGCGRLSARAPRRLQTPARPADFPTPVSSRGAGPGQGPGRGAAGARGGPRAGNVRGLGGTEIEGPGVQGTWVGPSGPRGRGRRPAWVRMGRGVGGGASRGRGAAGGPPGRCRGWGAGTRAPWARLTRPARGLGAPGVQGERAVASVQRPQQDVGAGWSARALPLGEGAPCW